jgi:hypothetical protein
MGQGTAAAAVARQQPAALSSATTTTTTSPSVGRRGRPALALATPLALLLLLLPLVAPLAPTVWAARAFGPELGPRDAAACVPTTIRFEGADEPARALVAAQTNPTPLAPGNGGGVVTLPLLRAVDDCGNEVPVVLEADGFSPAGGSLAPGDALDLSSGAVAGTPACRPGSRTVTYVAELPAGELLATKDFTFEVTCALPAP